MRQSRGQDTAAHGLRDIGKRPQVDGFMKIRIDRFGVRVRRVIVERHVVPRIRLAKRSDNARANGHEAVNREPAGSAKSSLRC